MHRASENLFIDKLGRSSWCKTRRRNPNSITTRLDSLNTSITELALISHFRVLINNSEGEKAVGSDFNRWRKLISNLLAKLKNYHRKAERFLIDHVILSIKFQRYIVTKSLSHFKSLICTIIIKFTSSFDSQTMSSR